MTNLHACHRVVFVLKETQPENWLNSGAGDFVAQLKPPDLSDVVDKVLDAEANYSHWSLFNRFCMANDLLDAADAAGGILSFLPWLLFAREMPPATFCASWYPGKHAKCIL